MSCYIFAPAKENLALLLRRVRDSKTNVRKAALQVLRSNRRRARLHVFQLYVFHLVLLRPSVPTSVVQALVGLLKHGVIPTTRENLETLAERSRDPAVSVKKKALQCLGELLTVSLDSSLSFSSEVS